MLRRSALREINELTDRVPRTLEAVVRTDRKVQILNLLQARNRPRRLP